MLKVKETKLEVADDYFTKWIEAEREVKKLKEKISNAEKLNLNRRYKKTKIEALQNLRSSIGDIDKDLAILREAATTISDTLQHTRAMQILHQGIPPLKLHGIFLSIKTLIEEK